MEGRFKEVRNTEISDIDTLRELISRLNETDEWQPVTRSEHVTVEDIAEALHLDPDYVAAELEELLEEHRQAKLSQTLRELEEPLYSVERTGHAVHDPLGNPLYKLRSVQILAERTKSKPVLARREEIEDSTDRFSRWVSRVIILLMLVMTVALVLKVILASR